MHKPFLPAQQAYTQNKQLWFKQWIFIFVSPFPVVVSSKYDKIFKLDGISRSVSPY